MQLEGEQLQAFDALQAWSDSHSTDPFYLAGLAGTGKTTIIKEWNEVNGGDTAYCAFTGKAAYVLRKKEVPATTIHRLIYDCYPDGKDSKGRVIFKFQKKQTLDCELIIVDEASMVPEDLRSDLEGYGLPIVYVGDHGQLGPVAPGGTSSNRMENADFTLETIRRQAEGNDIIRWAHAARQGELPPMGTHGTVHRVGRGYTLSAIEQALRTGGITLCGKNATRAELNRELREMCLGSRSKQGQIVEGDILVGLKNNIGSGIFNGMLVEVCTITGNYGEYDLVLRDEQGEELKSTTEGNLGSLSHNREYDAFDYGYALTVHKSQGSEWDTVALFNERMGDTQSYYRWLYTGMTRAAQELVIIG